MTSKTLSLDGNKVSRFPSYCLVESDKSYTLSHAEGYDTSLTCPGEDYIEWKILKNAHSDVDKPRVYISNLKTTQYCSFTIEGSVTFHSCSFLANTDLNLVGPCHKTHIYDDASLSLIFSLLKQTSLEILRSKIRCPNFNLFFTRVSAKILLDLNQMERTSVGIDFWEQRDCGQTKVIVNDILIHQNVLENSEITAMPRHEKDNSYASIRVVNTTSRGSGFKIGNQELGFIAALFDNCTFAGVFQGSRLQLKYITFVQITHCDFYLEHFIQCQEGCATFVTGRNIEEYMTDQMAFVRGAPFCDIAGNCHFIRATMTLENVIFEANGGQVSFVSSKNADLTITNGQMLLSEDSIPFHAAGLLDFRGHTLKTTNLTLDASEIESQDLDLSIMTFTLQEYIQVENVELLCPAPLGAVTERKEKSASFSHSFSCRFPCNGRKYTVEAGSMTLSGKQHLRQWSFESLIAAEVVPRCLPCPVGASCDQNLKALPNYWGYKDQSSVTMIRCPDGYCCTGNGTCTGIDACNNRRQGPLCGACGLNLSEALFSTQCVLDENCRPQLVISLYTLCALIYALILVSAKTLKTNILAFFKITNHKLKQQVQRLKNVESPAPLEEDNENQTTEDNTENTAQNENQTTDSTENTVENDKKDSEVATRDQSEESGMKYLQILFYYVQDASLFKVLLPSEIDKGESVFVNVLQMSPDVLTLYTQVVDLCLVPGSTAVAKVLFKSAFGPCVMMFVFISFICLKLLSKLRGNSASSFQTLRPNMVEAFLLTLLFSFQKIVIGVFTLVKCVQVGDSEPVLHIQGSVRCFTWWQNALQIFAFSNIIPVFFVVSHTPFHVKEKAMTVKMFVLACLFPIPALLYFYANKYLQNRKKVSKIPHQVECIEIETLSKVSVSTQSSAVGHTSSEEALLHTLLRHYKCLRVVGVRFTWLGIHKLYRVLLIALSTYINDPLTRLYAMTATLMALTVVNSLVKPYREGKANMTAVFSYAANIFVAIINLAKVGLVTFGCETNCSRTTTMLWFCNKAEDVLLVYLPVGACVLWFISVAVQKCKKSKRKE